MKKIFFYILCGVLVGVILAEPFLDDKQDRIDHVAIYPSFPVLREEHIPEHHYQTSPIQEISAVIGTTTLLPNFFPIYQVSTPEGTQTSNSSLLPYGYQTSTFQARALVASMGSIV